MGVKVTTKNKIAETSSKGNQQKWCENGIWYKLDQFGYEGLSETVVSEFLLTSVLESRENPFTYVHYNLEKILVNNIERTGCSSANFLKEGQSIITVNRLLTQHLGHPLRDELASMSSDKKRIQFIAEETAKVTGLDMFPQYLTLMFEIDSLFLNGDRHLNNIAVLEMNGEFDYCPIFDNGAALLSDTRSYPLDIDPKGLIPLVTASPFDTTFNRQVKSAQSLYGRQLQIADFTKNHLSKLLDKQLEYYPERDRELIKNRILTVYFTRLKAM